MDALLSIPVCTWTASLLHALLRKFPYRIYEYLLYGIGECRNAP